MWSSWPANQPPQRPTAVRPSIALRGPRARTITSMSPRAPRSRPFVSPFCSDQNLKYLKTQSHSRFSVSLQDDDTDASLSSSPPPESGTTTQDPTYVTAQGSSFFIGDDNHSLSYSTDCQSKEDLAGSYHYTAISDTPPDAQAQPAGRSSPNGGSCRSLS